MTRNGSTHERWQYKPTLKGDARIWFYVEGPVVYLEQVHAEHLNETKKKLGERKISLASGNSQTPHHYTAVRLQQAAQSLFSGSHSKTRE